MVDEQLLSQEVTLLLNALPTHFLLEFARSCGLSWLESRSRRLLGDGSLQDLVRWLFPEIPEASVPAVAREIELCEFQNSCWNHLLSLPERAEVKFRCLTEPAATALRERNGPAIIAIWHHGATDMVYLGLQAIGVPAVIIGGRMPDPWFWRTAPRETEFVQCGTDVRSSTIALKKALDRLKQGGVVVVATDGRNGLLDVETRFLDRKIRVSRGIAALARVTGASVIPALATWGHGDWSINFRIYDPLPLPPLDSLKATEWEREVMIRAVSFFDGIVRAFPGQCRLGKISRLAKRKPG